MPVTQLRQSGLAKGYQAVHAFFATTSGAAVLLLIAAIAALICTNTALRPLYEGLLHVKIGIFAGELKLAQSMAHWVTDGLMAIFFLLVGLEIKRELLTGTLSNVRRALLPTFAAIGGMTVPALIFYGFNYSDSAALTAWAVPVATDIAFSLGVLALLGARVPLALKVLLMAIAVIDDLGAIAIIALFYSGGLKLNLLGISVLLIVAMTIANWLGVQKRRVYLLLGLALWVCMLESGLHATMAGVFTAFCIPHGSAARGADTPLVSLEHDLQRPVTYLILPLFAFMNAGVNLEGVRFSMLVTEGLSAGIMFGLLVGKPLGIGLATWLAVKSNICRLPEGCNWPMIIGISMLCGIGFTVSLFIGNLGFEVANPELLNLVKVGVLSGSLLSGVLGYVYLRKVLASSDTPQD